MSLYLGLMSAIVSYLLGSLSFARIVTYIWTSGKDITVHEIPVDGTDENYKVFVHVVDGRGQLIAQHDGDPVGGFTPTTRWRQGEVIVDPHYVDLADCSRTSPCRLKAGMYLPSPIRNLPVRPASPDGRIDLGPANPE